MALRRGRRRRDLPGPEAGASDALWELGGVPEVVRSDNAAALTHEIRHSRARALNDNYAALLDHYGSSPPASTGARVTRTASRSRATTASRTPLIRPHLRGGRDFHTADDYARFVGEMVQRRNRLVQGKLEQERPHLRSLPPAPMPEYVNYRARVRKWSTTRPRPHLHGPLPPHRKEVQVRLYPDWVEVYYKGHLVEGMPGYTAVARPASTTDTSSAPW